MKKLLFLLLGASAIQAQSLRWGADFGDAGGSSICTDMATDAAGNIYAVGIFHDSVDFDPGPNVYYINELSASVGDVYCVKLNRNGQLLWARSVGGATGYATTEETTPAIAVDASGNIYVSGLYMNNVDMDPGNGTFFLPAPADSSTGNFMSKISPSGNLVWCKQVGGSFGWHFGRKLKLDDAGNIYIGGYFRNYTTFDINGTPLTLNSGYDKFKGMIAKFDNSGNGLWAFAIGNGDNSTYIRDIDVDGAGNIAVTGSFYGTIDFDGRPDATLSKTSVSTGSDAFLAKYGPDMACQWVKTISEADSNFSETGYSVAFDPTENIVSSGQFRNTANFGSESDLHELTAVGLSSIYFLKVTGSGDFVWANTIGAVSVDGSFNYSERGYSLDTDASGNVYATGNFLVHMDADPGPGTHFLEANGGSYQVFNLSLEPGGNFRWANAFGPDTNKNANGRAIVCNGFGDVIVGGNFQGPIDVNPGGTTATLAGHWPSYDSFVVSYNQPLLGLGDNFRNATAIWPNPAHDVLHITGENVVRASVCDISGKLILVTSGSDIGVSALSAGVYILRVETVSGIQDFRFIR